MGVAQQPRKGRSMWASPHTAQQQRCGI